MNPITLNQQPHQIKPAKRNAYNPIPLRWKYVLDLHLSGMSIKDIALTTGYSLNSIYRILDSEGIQHVRQQILDSTQQEFQALFRKVVDSVREDLDSYDPKVRVEARRDWLRAHGKVKESGGNQFTAEDMVVQIMNGDVVNE
jgi:hypothetical protein